MKPKNDKIAPGAGKQRRPIKFAVNDEGGNGAEDQSGEYGAAAE